MLLRFMLQCTLVVAFLAGSNYAQSLVFHNTFGSDSEILNSVVGPGLSFGNVAREYDAGLGGGCVTVAPPSNVYNNNLTILNNPGALLNAEQGTIAVRYKARVNPQGGLVIASTFSTAVMAWVPGLASGFTTLGCRAKHASSLVSTAVRFGRTWSR